MADESTYHEDIASALNALTAVEGMDDAMLSNADKERVQRIKSMSLRLIYKGIKTLYDAEFPRANPGSQESE